MRQFQRSQCWRSCWKNFIPEVRSAKRLFKISLRSLSAENFARKIFKRQFLQVLVLKNKKCAFTHPMLTFSFFSFINILLPKWAQRKIWRPACKKAAVTYANFRIVSSILFFFFYFCIHSIKLCNPFSTSAKRKLHFLLPRDGNCWYIRSWFKHRSPKATVNKCSQKYSRIMAVQGVRIFVKI